MLYTITFNYRDADRHVHAGSATLEAETAREAALKFLNGDTVEARRLYGDYLQVFETRSADVLRVFELKAGA